MSVRALPARPTLQPSSNQQPLTPPTRSRGTYPLTWRRDLPVVLGLLLLAALYAWIRVNITRGYFRGDMLTQYLPYYTLVAERVKDWDLPGWNPATFSGMPFAGDPTTSWGYFPSFVSFLLFAPVTAYKVYVALHLVLVTVTTYLLGRTLTMTPIGAAAAAVAMLLGPTYQYTQCCMVRMHLSAWIPAGLLLIECALRARSRHQRLLAGAGIGLVISQLIAGYFGKGMYLGILLFCAYLAYRTLLDSPHGAPDWRRRGREFLTILVVMLGTGVAFAAVTLLPRLEYIGHSNLKGGNYDAVSAAGAVEPPSWSVGQALATVLDPDQPTYFLGAATVVLAIVGLALAGRRFCAPFFALVSSVVVILTLSPTPLHRLVYLIPRFKSLHEHDPQIILVLLAIGPALLVGAALTAIEEQAFTRRRLVIAAGAPLVTMAFVALLVRRDDLHLSTSLFELSVLVGGAIALGLLLVWRGHRALPSQRLSTLLAVGLLVVLLGNLDHGRLNMANARHWDARPTDATTSAYASGTDVDGAGVGAFFQAQLASEGLFRFAGYNSAYLSLDHGAMKDNYRQAWRDPLAAGLLLNNRALTLGLYDVQGYDPVQEANYVAFMTAVNGQEQEYHEANILPSGLTSPLLRMLNLRYIVIPVDAPDTEDFRYLAAMYPEVYRDASVRVLAIPNTLPRAWAVHDVRQVASDQVLPLLSSGAVDPATTALMTTAPPTLAPQANPSGDRVSITQYEPDHIGLEAELASDGLVVLSEVYDPGWTVRIDGKRAKLYEVDGLLRALAVPAGVHHVELVYAPAALRAGFFLTIATLVMVIAIVLLLWWRAEKQSARIRVADHYRKHLPALADADGPLSGGYPFVKSTRRQRRMFAR